MSKAFSFLELIIATALISIVVISLLNIESNSLFIVEKTKENSLKRDYLLASFNSNSPSNKSSNIYLDKEFNQKMSDDLRRELKEIKVSITEIFLGNKVIDEEEVKYNIEEYKVTYNLANGNNKELYKFKLTF